MKLISMTDFVIEIDENKPKFKNFSSFSEINQYEINGYDKIRNYANFLKQPLKLEMFVPCDEEGNILEKPIHKFITRESDPISFDNYSEKYKKAKEKVLFEGFKFYSSYTDSIYVAEKKSNLIQFKNNGDVYVLDEFLSNSISDLIFYFQKEKINLTLTPNAIKQIGL